MLGAEQDPGRAIRQSVILLLPCPLFIGAASLETQVAAVGAQVRPPTVGMDIDVVDLDVMTTQPKGYIRSLHRGHRTAMSPPCRRVSTREFHDRSQTRDRETCGTKRIQHACSGHDGQHELSGRDRLDLDVQSAISRGTARSWPACCPVDALGWTETVNDAVNGGSMHVDSQTWAAGPQSSKFGVE